MVYSSSSTPPDVMWTLVSTNTTSSNSSGDIVQFATHGNDTVFFSYPPVLLDLAAGVFVLFAVVGVIGNLVTVIALSRSRRLRGNATTAFVVNLGVADLMFCAVSMPLSALTFFERDWNYGDALCKLFPLVRYSNAAVSLFSVISITVNRYILIAHPSLYKSMYTPLSIAIMIILQWVSALVILMFPLAEVWGKLGYDPKVGTCTILKLYGKSPKMALYVLAFALPSVIFLACYTRIYCVVRKSSRRTMIEMPNLHRNISVSFSSKKAKVLWKQYRHSEMVAMTDSSVSRSRDHKELRVLKVMMVIFVTFVLCYFPASAVKIFSKEDDWPTMNVLGYLGVYFSNIINPVIYVVMSEEYRKAYRELFCPGSIKTGSASNS